jgi:hypothetical protein
MHVKMAQYFRMEQIVVSLARILTLLRGRPRRVHLECFPQDGLGVDQDPVSSLSGIYHRMPFCKMIDAKLEKH